VKRCTLICQRHSQAGFSMVELCAVTLVIFIIAGFALLNVAGILPRIRANSALSDTVAQLRQGRSAAITQRRNVEIRFLGDNQIWLVRRDVPAGTTVLRTVTLANDITFCLFGGLPDTPDLFGNSGSVDFGGATTALFLSDGTLVDAAGDPLNGTVFLGLADHPETARAVTILGATGRVRDYRWTGTSWVH